jgi:hypothetical protein
MTLEDLGDGGSGQRTILGLGRAVLQEREEHRECESSREEPSAGGLQLPSTETPNAVSTWPIWLAKV